VASLAQTIDERELEGVDGEGLDLSRIIGLSDGVFGFAMTFLVITLALPELANTSHIVPPLGTYLSGLWPSLLGYVLAFTVISSWWGNHHRLFSAFRRYDRRLIALNSLFLLTISITPFSLSILTTYGPSGLTDTAMAAKASVLIFAGTQLAAGLLMLAIWRHATHGHRLVSPVLPQAWIDTMERGCFTSVGVFALSMLVALVLPQISEFLWIAMIFSRSQKMKKSSIRRSIVPAAGTPTAGAGG
jgi:uncharacterized membrane protein